MDYVIGFVVGALAGFTGGIWYCKPVRDELKALRASAVATVKSTVGKL